MTDGPSFELVVPVYVPDSNFSTTSMELGTARLSENKLEIEFNGRFPSIALQRMLARGEILGLTFVQAVATEVDDGQEREVTE